MIEKFLTAVLSGEKTIELFVLIIVSFFILILFAVGSMVWVKFKREMKKLQDGNGHHMEMEAKIDKLFSMYSKIQADVHYIKGQLEILTHRNKRDLTKN